MMGDLRSYIPNVLGKLPNQKSNMKKKSENNSPRVANGDPGILSHRNLLPNITVEDYTGINFSFANLNQKES